MAGDPLRPVQPGGHSPLVRNARTVNAVLEATRAYQRTRRNWGSRGFEDPPAWGVDHYTDPANSDGAGYDQRWASWSGRFSAGTTYYSWETTCIKSELIIPANSGWVWVSGGIYVQHGPGTWTDASGMAVSLSGASATDRSYQVVARAAIRDLDDMASSMSGRITDWKKFAAGQVYAVEGASSQVDPVSIVTGNYDPQEGGYSAFHGEADFGLLLFVGETAKRLAFVAGFYIQGPAIGGLQYAFRATHGYTGSSSDVLNKGRCWLTYQPVNFTTTTPDVTALAITATESPDNGTHAATHTVAFYSSVTGGEPSFTYAWDFGDSSTSTSAAPSHGFAYAGTYRPLVTVVDSIGQSATAQLNTITITGGSSPPPPPPPPPPPTSNCTACDLVGNYPTLVVPDGPNAGTWTANSAWQDVGAYYVAGWSSATGFGGVSTYCIRSTCTINGVTYHAGDVVIYVGDTAKTDTGNVEQWQGDTTSVGPPAIMTFAGTHLKAAGNLTLTT